MRYMSLMAMGLFLILLCSGAQAGEDAARLEDIVVRGQKLVSPTKQTNETVYTGSEITREGMDIQGSQGETSVYEIMDILPGINVESPDPYGLAAEQRNVRVRGVRGYLGSMTVEGVPNWGGNPMGPREYIYDTENFDRISIYKGAVPGDFGTGVGARGGAIELKPRWPEEKPGIDFSQAFGTDAYTRSYVRLDSGKIPGADTGVSLSYSYTDADKWKGPGDLGPRNNVNLMLKQPLAGGDSIRAWVNYNELSQNLYRSLSYQETQNLGANYEKDFNSALSGVKLQDIYYYDYNKGDYENLDLMTIIPLSFGEALRFSLKPYYSTEDSKILGGVTTQGGLIQKRTRDIERYGAIMQLDGDMALSETSSLLASLGYFYEANDMAIITQNFDPLTFANKGYGMYTENDGNGIVHSPFVKLAGNMDKLDWQTGLKYFYYNDPASRGYTSTAPTYALVRASDLDREEKEYDKILPTAGLGYNFSDSLNVYTSFGRNFIRPYSYVPIVTTYNTNRATFQAQGITLNDLFKGYNMEISDNYEIGMRFRSEKFEILPALFYSTHDNLLTTIYDPRVNLSYQQNIGKATGYGLDLGANVFLTPEITLFFNPTYTILTYDGNLTYQGAVLNSDGRQVVDTPEWMVKTGLIYRRGPFEVTAMLRYLGERYGDVEHKEVVDDFITADLHLKYTRKIKSWNDTVMNIGLQLQNLTDEEYIAVVSASDDSRAGSTGYYAGAPFTAILAVSFEY
nr:TonB-dependent receptor [Desulfobacula sp.]